MQEFKGFEYGGDISNPKEDDFESEEEEKEEEEI